MRTTEAEIVLYSWLKESPQERAPMLQYIYAIDADVYNVLSEGNKRQLRELINRKLGINDAVLWAQELSYMKRITLDEKYARTVIDFYDMPWFMNSVALQHLYSYAQERNFDTATDACYLLCDAVASHNPIKLMYSAFNIPYSALKPVLDVAVDAKLNHFGLTHIARVIAERLWMNVTNAQFMPTGEVLEVLTHTCTPQCIRTICELGSQPRGTYIDMIKDTVTDDYGKHKFKSLNDIDRAHKAMTLKQEQQVLQKYADRQLRYNDEFFRICKAHGYALPSSAGDLVIRGQVHHHCVASYTDRHTKYSETGPMSRVLLGKHNTLELVFDVYDRIIYRVSVGQNRGPFNKGVDIDIKLRDLIIACIGKDVSMLIVEESSERT